MQRLLFFAVILFATSAGASGQLYETEFDDDTGWTFVPATGYWRVNTCYPVLSAPSALHYTCGNYTDSGTATGPAADLSSTTDPLLVFWCGYATEDNDCGHDIRHVQVSNDGFTTLLLDQCFSASDCPFDFAHPHHIPLDASWGTVQVRFYFDTIDDLFNYGYGWTVDDLSIVDDQPAYPRNFCLSEENSATTRFYGAVMGFDGTTSVAANDLRLKATRCPPNQLSLFLMSQSQNQFPAGDGIFCLGGPFYRMYPASPTGGAGTPTKNVDYASPAVGAMPIVAGSTWSFQNWFRDPPAGNTGSNFSDGLEVTFTP